VEINGNVPLFTDAEMTTSSYEYYSELDSLGRCGVCVASIGTDLMPTEERGTIGSVKPTGWHTVKYTGIAIDYATGDSETDGTEVATTEVATTATGTYAVNANNGKIHIVGACPATEVGSNAMKNPVYFDTYEEAQAYSEKIAPSQSKRNCGNCW
jgi:hypothetical protein